MSAIVRSQLRPARILCAFALILVLLGAPLPTTARNVVRQLSVSEPPRTAAERSPRRPAPTTPGGEGRATALAYRRNCQTCHGADGKGGGARRAGIPYIPDFTRETWQRKRSDNRLRVSILDGKGTFMPAFRDKLTEDQAGELVAHLRGFHPHAKKPRETDPDDFDMQLRRLQDEMKKLRRQFDQYRSPPAEP